MMLKMKKLILLAFLLAFSLPAFAGDLDAGTGKISADYLVLSSYTTKLVSVSRDISLTSDLSVTGVGFTPKGAIIISNIAGTANLFVGLVDGSRTIGGFRDHSGTSAGTYSVYSNIVIGLDNNHFNQGAISAWTSDGCTITWSKSGTPTGTATIYFLFFR